jgi:purine-binding chemotaxis protein CheW
MTQDLLIARVCGERFAIAATAVDSVIELGEVVPAPRAPAFIAGLTTLRSRSLTVIDTARALGLTPAEQLHRFALVIELGGCGYAVAVDAVESVVSANGPVGPLRVKLPGDWARVALGIVDTPVGVVLMVDHGLLVAGPKLMKVEQL